MTPWARYYYQLVRGTTRVNLLCRPRTAYDNDIRVPPGGAWARDEAIGGLYGVSCVPAFFRRPARRPWQQSSAISFYLCCRTIRRRRSSPVSRNPALPRDNGWQYSRAARPKPTAGPAGRAHDPANRRPFHRGTYTNIIIIAHTLVNPDRRGGAACSIFYYIFFLNLFFSSSPVRINTSGRYIVSGGGNNTVLLNKSYSPPGISPGRVGVKLAGRPAAVYLARTQLQKENKGHLNY